MAITLTSHPQPAYVLLEGHQGGIVISPGQSLVAETSPGGEEILVAECPVGKQWTVKVTVEITEIDA